MTETNEQVIIERLQDNDRESALALLCAFKEESQQRSPIYDDLRSDYKEILANYIDEYRSHPDRRVLVAKIQGTVIGVIMGTIWNYLPIYTISRMGYIPELFIARQFRGHGVGSALIRAMELWFRERGIEFARIETIIAYDKNQSLYEKLGYRPFLIDLRRQLD
jgi:GNAT superfamily N-acetyltransferase